MQKIATKEEIVNAQRLFDISQVERGLQEGNESSLGPALTFNHAYWSTVNWNDTGYVLNVYDSYNISSYTNTSYV